MQMPAWAELLRAKEEGVVELPLKNPQGKHFAWSHTALAQYRTCPNQYAGSRFYEKVKFVETEATRWGNTVHKALENRLKGKAPELPPGMQKWDKYCRAFLDAADKKGGALHAELKITINRNFHLTSWFGSDAFGRCMLDVVIDCGDTVYIYDWKTGKKKHDPAQLRTNAAMAHLRFPDAEKFVTKYVWLIEDGSEATTGEIIPVEDIPDIWGEIIRQIVVLEESWMLECFPLRPSGLCYGWCGYKQCSSWKPKK